MALTIMPLGDSITYGYRQYNDDNSIPPGLAGWRDDLKVLLGASIEFVGEFKSGPASLNGGVAFDRDHQGVPGVLIADLFNGTTSKPRPGLEPLLGPTRSIEQIIQDPDPKNPSDGSPEAVLLMTGSNDVYNWAFHKILPDGTPVLKTFNVSMIKDIVKDIHAKDSSIEVFVSTIPPQTSNVPWSVAASLPPDWANTIDGSDVARIGINGAAQGSVVHATADWNKWIIDNVPTWGDHVHLVNMTNYTTGNPKGIAESAISMTGYVEYRTNAAGIKYEYPDNGLHPNDAGYATIAEKWKEALVKVFPDELNPVSIIDPTVSKDFADYVESVRGGQPVVSLGEGDGKDQVTAFQFAFEPPKTISAATLTLEMEPGDDLVYTDELLFYDNTSKRGPQGKEFGNALIKYLYDHNELPLNETSTVTFDLRSIDTNTGKESLEELLDGGLATGYLGVVYADDAIIYSARLDVAGDYGDHEPGTTRSIAGTDISQLYLGGGNDTAGGHSVDWIHGESGNDTILGYDGDDTLFGGKGNDSLAGGDDDDLIVGGDDDDTLDGQNGNDSIYGDLGHERNEGNDVINGGNGEDQVLAGGGNDTVYGGLDDDWLNGQWGSDWVSGDGGNDVIIGEDGNDTLYGGSGDDYFLAGLGGDYVTGGPGNDTITFDDILQSSKLFGFDKIRGFDNPGPKAGDIIDLHVIDARPDLAGDQAFKLVTPDRPQWGGVWVFDHSWGNSTMVQGWIGPTPPATHGDWFQFWILDGPNVHARDYTAEDFVL